MCALVTGVQTCALPISDRRTVAGTTCLRAGSMGGATMARSWRRQLTHTLAALAVAAAVVGTGARAEAAAQPPRDTSRYACPASTPNPFSDIAGNTHESAIRCMTRYGFVNGKTSTTFDPSTDVTRAQLASFLARGLAYTGVPLDTTGHGFVDIDGSPHAGAVNALANLNVIAGTSATRFQPNRFVTRAQAASMTARLLRPAGALPLRPTARRDPRPARGVPRPRPSPHRRATDHHGPRVRVHRWITARRRGHRSGQPQRHRLHLRHPLPAEPLRHPCSGRFDDGPVAAPRRRPARRPRRLHRRPGLGARGQHQIEIGRASCRERVCQYV